GIEMDLTAARTLRRFWGAGLLQKTSRRSRGLPRFGELATRPEPAAVRTAISSAYYAGLNEATDLLACGTVPITRRRLRTRAISREGSRLQAAEFGLGEVPGGGSQPAGTRTG